MADKPIGKVTHYFDHIKVAVIKLERGKSLQVGDSVQLKNEKIDFSQKIKSLQVDHKDVKKVKAADDFGLEVNQPVKEGVKVFLA